MSTLFNITNNFFAPLKVFYDKSYEYLTYYFYDYFKDENNVNIERIYKRISTYKQVISFFKQPTYIIDNIWLGNARNAASFYDLHDKNIKMIINVTNEISNYYPNSFEYINYKINDNNKDTIINFLNDSYNKIKNYQQKNKDKHILIHCFMGSSRSASILLFYLMKTLKNDDDTEFTLNQAINFLKEKRNVINPSEKFILDLQDTIHLQNKSIEYENYIDL